MTIASTCLLAKGGPPHGRVDGFRLVQPKKPWSIFAREPRIGPRTYHPMRELGRPNAVPSIDRDSIVPIYQQIYEDLREAILTGTLPESTRLPPERSLAEKLNVNRSTVVHAYRELVADGLIEQRVGSGSRVVPQLRGGQPERAAGVPWWVTLPPWRVGEFPNVLGELAAKP